MRIFTELEKDLLRRLNNGDGNNLIALIDPWIEGFGFEINVEPNTLTIISEVQNPNDPEFANVILDRLVDIQSILIQAVNLIKLFEDKGYLYTFRQSQQINYPFYFGRYAVNVPSIPYSFPDSRIYDLVKKYTTEEILVTPELNKFIKDDFITREEVRANRQYRVTRFALSITIIGLLFSLGFNVYNSLKKSTDDKQINIENSNVFIHTKRNHEINYYEKKCKCFQDKKDSIK
jgi:hypothetical protein